jgi:hypothetical protein
MKHAKIIYDIYFEDYQYLYIQSFRQIYKYTNIFLSI